MKGSILPVLDSDFSQLEGSGCFCSPETACLIRKAVRNLPLNAIHMLGSGDRHYVYLFWMERIDRPFTLILFDNHPDDQPSSFGDGLLSCGSWVLDARRLENCRGTVWIDGNGEKHIYGTVTRDAWLSVDLDILGTDHYITNWNQGNMTTSALCSMLSDMKSEHNIIGVDICGAPSEDRALTSCEIAANRLCLDTITATLRITERQ